MSPEYTQASETAVAPKAERNSFITRVPIVLTDSPIRRLNNVGGRCKDAHILRLGRDFLAVPQFPQIYSIKLIRPEDKYSNTLC
jgi:hypothetical protein